MKSAEEWFNQGIDLYYSKYDYDGALSAFQATIKANSSFSDARAMLANVFRAKGNNQMALQILDNTIAIDKSNPLVYYIKARTLAASDKSNAEKIFEIGKQFQKNDTYLLSFMKGVVLCALDKYQESIVHYDRAILLKSNFACAYLNKGLALHDLGKLEEAIPCYGKAIQINPNFADAYYNKGLALYDLGKKQDAIQCYDKAIQLKPDDPYYYSNKGLALYDLGKFTDAIQCYDKAIQLNPDNALCLCNRGKTYKDLGRNDLALKDLRAASNLLDQGKTEGLSQGNINYMKGVLKDLVALEETVASIQKDVDKLDQNNAQVKKFIGLFKEVITRKDSSISKILDQKHDKEVGTQEKQANQTEIANLKQQIEHMKKIMTELASNQQEQQWQIEKHEDNIQELNIFKSKFSESTLKFEEKKKDAETVMRYNPKLNDYYKGFINEFDIAFVAAQSVESGNISFEPEINTYKKILSKTASFIPMFGDIISSGIDLVNKKISTIELKARCANISKFGVNTTEFNKIAEYIAASIILDYSSKAIIESYTEQDSKNWIAKIKSAVAKVKSNLEDAIMKNYKNDMSPQEALGRKDAQGIISKHIASGAILDFQESRQLDKLTEFCISSHTEFDYQQESIEQSEGEKLDNSARCSGKRCIVFGFYNAKVDDPNVNHISKAPISIQKVLFDILVSDSFASNNDAFEADEMGSVPSVHNA